MKQISIGVVIALMILFVVSSSGLARNGGGGQGGGGLKEAGRLMWTGTPIPHRT